MKLVHTGFLCLTLFVLATGFLSPAPGGLGGGFGGIFTAVSNINQCPDNYIHTPNDPSTCIRFFNTTKDFDAAKASCESDGGSILRLDSATFGLIRQLTVNRTDTGTCNLWVGATEGTDDTWSALNGDPIPKTAGLFFQDASNTVDDRCGLMNNANNFLLIGSDCTDPQCYICQRNIYSYCSPGGKGEFTIL